MAYTHVQNGHHGSVPSELTSCPLCGQLLPNGTEVARIHAKVEADREAARREGIAAAQPQIAALSNQILDLKEGQDATVNERVERERLAIEARNSGALRLKDAEIARLTKKIDEAKRMTEGRTPQELGKMGQLEAFNMLKAAFPGDKITYIPPGKPGADLIHEVIHDGKEEGNHYRRDQERDELGLVVDGQAAPGQAG